MTFHQTHIKKLKCFFRIRIPFFLLFQLILVLATIKTLMHGHTVKAVIVTADRAVEDVDAVLKHAPSWAVGGFAVEAVLRHTFSC